MQKYLELVNPLGAIRTRTHHTLHHKFVVKNTRLPLVENGMITDGRHTAADLEACNTVMTTVSHVKAAQPRSLEMNGNSDGINSTATKGVLCLPDTTPTHEPVCHP